MDTQLREAARAWIADDPDPANRAELSALLEAGDDDELAERFAEPLAFGTAGICGPSWGRADADEPGHRARGGGRPGPVPAGRGPDGAQPAGRHRLRRPPWLPAVRGRRRRGAGRRWAARAVVWPVRSRRRCWPSPSASCGPAAGVMITASHNPREDNGYKVYLGRRRPDHPARRRGDRGGRGVGPAAPSEVPLGGPGERLGPEIIDAYLDAVVPAALPARPVSAEGRRMLRVAYTPLHGVGRDTALAAFRRAGFAEPAVVAAQAEPDGAFPTLPRSQPRGARRPRPAHRRGRAQRRGPRCWPTTPTRTGSPP